MHWLFRCLLLLGPIGLCPARASETASGRDEDGLLTFDSRWEYPHFLTWRPAHAAVVPVNPPRFSWPAVPHVIATRDQLTARDFRFQLSRRADFFQPEHDVVTPYNFFNALPVLPAGTWHWRIGYSTDAGVQWSGTRTFQIGGSSVEWDRTIIQEAAKLLAAKSRPRLGPTDGNWQRMRQQLETDRGTRPWLRELLKRADEATRKDWWASFPASDRKGETTLNEIAFTDIAFQLAVATLAWKVTGDSKFAPVKNHFLALTRFPPGGYSSPEYKGAGNSKWPTQIIEYLAVGYDWLHAELTPAERHAFRAALDWRLRAVYFEKHSWRNGTQLAHEGVAVFCRSHPYENLMWSLPAVLLMAGELPVADELAPLVLNYIAGVTSAHGPDEGWNEGVGYSAAKGASMLWASVHVALLLPELKIGRNPYYSRLSDWLAHLTPLGIERLPFGDYAASLRGSLAKHPSMFRHLAWLSGEGRAETRRRAVADLFGNGVSPRPWLDLFGGIRFRHPEPRAETTRAMYPEGGWVMASNRPPSAKDFGEAVGMIFQCRPRGGFGHSYRAENDFAWHAYGQTLSAGGGTTRFPDPHSRHSLSHNVVLVNGVGQEWDPLAPRHPYCGRLLAFRESKDHVYWAGDATRAYQTVPDLLRWHRHVVFVADRCFVLLDDLAMRPGSRAAKFSWLFHVAPKVDLQFEPDRAGFRYRMKDVNAQVMFAKPPGELEIVDLENRQGFTNPLTGEDLYPAASKALGTGDRKLTEADFMAHNIWITNRRPAGEWTLMTLLLAHRDGEGGPRTEFLGDRAVRLEWADGTARMVSFDRDRSGDIEINLERVRQHAAAPERLR